MIACALHLCQVCSQFFAFYFIFYFIYLTGYWHFYIKTPWYNKSQVKCRRLDSDWSICKNSSSMFLYYPCHYLHIFVLRYLMHFSRSYQMRRHQLFVKHFHHFREWSQFGNSIKMICQNMPYLLRLVFQSFKLIFIWLFKFQHINLQYV